jgi:hypothetical protein
LEEKKQKVISPLRGGEVSTPEYLVVSKQSFDFFKTGCMRPVLVLPARLARRKMYRVKGRLLCVVQVQ